MINFADLTDAQLIAATTGFEPDFNPKTIDAECTHCGKPLKVAFNRKDKTNFCSDRCRNAERDAMYKYHASTSPTIPRGHVIIRGSRGRL